MEITIVDATGSKAEEAEVPGDVASGRIITRLVELMALPKVGPDGEMLSYRFHHKRSGRQINDDDTLDDSGVEDGDVIRLVPEMTAGRGPSDFS